jgi:hypothetical protein
VNIGSPVPPYATGFGPWNVTLAESAHGEASVEFTFEESKAIACEVDIL